MNRLSEVLARHPAPSGRGTRFARDLLIWLPGCLGLGLLVAWAAVDAQFYFAPLLLFPLLVGVLLGALLVLLMRMARVGHRPTIVLGTLLAAGVAVVGMHYFLYLSSIRETEAASAALEQLRQGLPESAVRQLPAPPGNFAEYMAQQAAQGRPVFQTLFLRGGYAWLLWTVEGLLLFAATLGVVVPAMNFAFCRHCHSWYRTIRSARVPAAVLHEIAAILNVETPERLRSGRCRFSACLGGCRPTGCELMWEDLEGRTDFARLWLHPEQRNRVMQVLDDFAQRTPTSNAPNTGIPGPESDA